MGSIFRTNNPLQYDEVDGIVVDERAPEPNVNGVGTGVAIMVAKFERGNTSLTQLTSLKNFHEEYGKSLYGGNIQLKNKRFSSIKLIRVIATDAALATQTADTKIKFDAKHKGVYGNKILVKIEAGSVSGSKYTISDTNDFGEEIFSTEVYDNILITDISELAASKLVDVSLVGSPTVEPAVQVATALAAGSDGTIADTDYETAIAKAAGEGAGNVLFLDEYNSTRNTYLKVHAGLTQDKMVILAGGENDSVSTIQTNVTTLRDTDGRIIYADNWVETLVNGSKQYTSPASWVASLISQVPPHMSIGAAENAGLLFGITGLKNDYTRQDYIDLNNAGVAAFEFDADIGFGIKSAVVTQIANSSKITILRRRMADFLTNSMGKFLKLYKDAVNKQSKRVAAKSALLRFIDQNEKLEILPKDSEVQGGKAKVVDIDSLNDNDSIAAGKFFIKYKQRIFSSMRFIVLQAEIGESVVVTEEDE